MNYITLSNKQTLQELFTAASNTPNTGVYFYVQLAKDRIPVISDNEKYDPTLKMGAGYLRDYTSTQLANPAEGLPIIPTLQEALEQLQKTSLRCIIIFKTDVIDNNGIERKVISLIEQFKLLDRVSFACVSPTTLHRCLQYNPTIDMIKIVRYELNALDLAQTKLLFEYQPTVTLPSSIQYGCFDSTSGQPSIITWYDEKREDKHMEFKKEPNRIYLDDESGKIIAVIDFPEESEGVVNITHTEVDNVLRGQGIAGKLTQAAVDQLREDGRKAVLSCSYVMKWFGKHPEYQDVLFDPAKEAEKLTELNGEACSIRKA